MEPVDLRWMAARGAVELSWRHRRPVAGTQEDVEQTVRVGGRTDWLPLATLGIAIFGAAAGDA